MRFYIYIIIFLVLASCQNSQLVRDNIKSKKSGVMIMKATSDAKINIKKWKI